MTTSPQGSSRRAKRAKVTFARFCEHGAGGWASRGNEAEGLRELDRRNDIMRDEIIKLRHELEKARRLALEEAAKVLEVLGEQVIGVSVGGLRTLAARIRALAASQNVSGSGTASPEPTEGTK